MTGNLIPNPTHYGAGYQAAVTDLLRALEQGGIPNVLDWLTNNTNDHERTDAAIQKAAPHGTSNLTPPDSQPIFSTGDISVLTAALQHWLGLGDKRYTYEQIGRLFVRLAQAGQLAFDSGKFNEDGDNQ